MTISLGSFIEPHLCRENDFTIKCEQFGLAKGHGLPGPVHTLLALETRIWAELHVVGEGRFSYGVLHFSVAHLTSVCTISYTPTQHAPSCLCAEDEYVSHFR